MPSSKGEPTDPQLRERIKEQIKKEAGGGWAAWCGAKLAKEYERQGGGYKNTPDNPNKPKKGTPEPKEGENRAAGGAAQTAKREKKEAEGKKGDGEKPDSKQKPSPSSAQKKDAGKKREASAKADGAEEPKEKKAKANNGASKEAALKEKKAKAPAKEPTKGERQQPKRGAKK